MLGENIKYTDYNGVNREEKFFFNLSKAELMEMELGVEGGLSEILKKIIKEQNVPRIMEIFKKLVLKAYGEKSQDHKRFIRVDQKGFPVSQYFEQTPAYSELYVRLASDAEYAAKFVRGIIPSDIDITGAENELKAELNISDNKEENSSNIIPINKGE